MPSSHVYSSSAALDHAFDIALVPEALRTDDPLDQTDPYLAALFHEQESRGSAIRAFNNASPMEIGLDDLERIYDRGNSSLALRTLQSRRRVKCAGRHLVNFDPRTMFWDTHNTYLDLLVCVGLDIGLAPVIPSLMGHHNFSFKIELNKSYRPFTAKHVKLGFDPVGCMMCIARTGAGEDAWLAFIPRGQSEEIPDLAAPIPNSKTTCLTLYQQRRVRMFIAHCFKNIGYRDVTVTDMYPDVANKEEVDYATNIVQQILDLNLQELKQLDKAIVRCYRSWVEGAPPSYLEDGFFTSRHPICVTSRYGQNHRVGVNWEQEQRTWDYEREWSRIRYVNIALATHMSVQQVHTWYPADINDLLHTYEDGIFDSHEEATRTQLSEREIQEVLGAPAQSRYSYLYTTRGYIVQPHDPTFQENSRPYGILIKAEGLHRAFEPSAYSHVVRHPADVGEEDDHHVDDLMDLDPTSFYFYPQAGLRTVGHFQADGIFSTCRPIVSRLNKALRTANRQLHEDEVMSDPSQSHDLNADSDYYTSFNVSAVKPLHSQGYNAIMHHTRGRSAQHHDAQLGLVTAALAGQWVTGANSDHIRSAAEVMTACEHQLPHEAFREKIKPDNLSADLRLENVYSIDLLALHPTRRTGSVILSKIIRPLMRIWDHATTRSSIEQHVQLFRPEAYPALYSWTSYPLTCLLEKIFTQSTNLYPERKLEHSLMVELCSVVERALNYMHTGNAAVIASSVMTPLWVGKALIADGLPCFNPEVVVLLEGHSGPSVKITEKNWPLDKKSARPLSSSQATQLFRYNQHHFNTFYAHLAIGIVVASPPPPFVRETNEARRRAFAIMVHCVTLFIDDCKEFVSQKVSKEIKRQRSLPLPESDHAEARSQALAHWKNTTHPLSYGGENAPTYTHLLMCISPNPEGPPPEGTAVKESLTYKALAIHMFSFINNNSLPAPMWKSGSFKTALQIAVLEITRLLDVPPNDNIGHIVPFLATTLRDLAVDFIPWHGPQRGSRNNILVMSHLYWMSLDRSTNAGPGPAAPLPASLRISQIQQAAISRAISDPFLEWSVPKSLTRMFGLWRKLVLPNEWSLKVMNFENGKPENGNSQTNYDYMEATYRWLHRNYRGDFWAHNLGLVVTILFTTVLPNIYVSLPLRDTVKPGSTAAKVNEKIRSWPWLPNDSNKKGLKDPRPFITMLSTYIIALLDPSSPLRQYISQNSALGALWTNKHSMWAILDRIIMLTLLPDRKYIHLLCMVRLRICDATSAGMAKVAKWGDNIQLRPEAELRAMHSRVMTYLCEDEQYGVYFAIKEILGEHGAEVATKAGHCRRPVIY